MAFFQETSWHGGEIQLQEAMKTPDMDNPTFPSLSPQLSNHLQIAPVIAIGTLDASGRPWTTLWGGEKGLARPLGGGIVGIRAAVVGQHDPVVETLVGKDPAGTVVREEGKGRMVAGLTIDPETRKRVKMFGRMVAGALGKREDEVTDKEEHLVEVQLVLKIEQSLGNCPKYINRRRIVPAVSKPELLFDSPKLTQQSIDLINKSDLFFVSSAQHSLDMDTNHRGGPAGFLRVVSNEPTGAVVCWPEYSGNRMYQTLGNLKVNPLAGLCIPDFDTGDMLYFTGTTEILIGKDAAALLPRSNLCVKLTITSARYIRHALPFRGVDGEPSPYNPMVRYLTTEKPPTQTSSQEGAADGLLRQATLISQTRLTPTISRFHFALEKLQRSSSSQANDPAALYRPGQYVTLDFSSHLDFGYSHMRDDDPRSLNDDFIRTFTVSNPLPSSSAGIIGESNNDSSSSHDDDDDDDPKEGEFEITIRKVGVATDLLFKHDGKTERMAFEVGVKGFGGEFEIVQENEGETVGFVAAGVGITPILSALGGGGGGGGGRKLDLGRVKVLWSVRKEDLGLVEDVVRRCPGLLDGGGRLKVFVTNLKKDDDDETRNEDGGVGKLKEKLGNSNVCLRRIEKSDLDELDVLSRVYICTGVPMRQQVMGWLPTKQLIFEDFNF